MRRSILLVLVAMTLSGCSGLGRKINRALPEFLRSEPGEEEIERLGKRRRAVTRTADEIAALRATYDDAQALYDSKDYETAAEILEEFLELHPDTPFDQEARALLIRSHREDGDYYEAGVALKTFLEFHPVSEYSGELEQMAWDMAAAYLSGERDFWIFDRRGDGVKLLEDMVIHFPNGHLADDAWWRIASHHREKERWIEAQGAYDALVERHKDSEWAPVSLYLRGVCRHQRIKGTDYDSENMKAAIKDYQLYIKNYPDGGRVAEAEEAIAAIEETLGEKQLRIARWYQDRGHQSAARFFYHMTAMRHGSTEAGQTARKILTQNEDPQP